MRQIYYYIILKSVLTIYMSNSITFNDFYQVPDVTFDINKLRKDLDQDFKKIKIPNIRYF